MILVLAGTREGREIAGLLRRAGRRVLATAVTAYGGGLLAEEGAAARVGALSEAAMAALIRNERVRLVIDATHPFALTASANAVAACRSTGVPYVRYERSGTALPDHPLIRRVRSYDEAAALAAEPGQVIFLTTGSNSLEVFVTAAREKGCRVVARVLPQPEVLARCAALGLGPRDIVAMQGPFSRALNRTLYREYGASVVVTKESGDTGGVADKVAAALDLSLPVVVIERPAMVCGRVAHSYEDILKIASEVER